METRTDGIAPPRNYKRLSQLTGKSRNEIRRLLQDSAMTSFSNDSEVLEKVAQVVPLLQNNDVIQALNAELTKTMGELGNLTHHYDAIAERSVEYAE